MFTSPWRTWLSASVLSPSAASSVASLERHGYSAPIATAYLHAVGHFAYWLTEEHLTLRRLDESVVRRFLTTHLPTCRCPGRCQRTVVGVQAALGHLLDVLRADGRIPERRVGLSPAIHDELKRFTSHLEQVCGLAAKTRAGRRWWAGQFLADRFGRGPIAVDRLTARDIADYLEGHGTRYTPGTAASAAARCAATCASEPHGAAIAWRRSSPRFPPSRRGAWPRCRPTSHRTKPLGSWMHSIGATRPANAGTPWRAAWWIWAYASAKSPACSWMM